jgi:hypothetical protein
MKYLKLFESNNLDHKKILREVLDIIFDNQLISKRVEENFYFLYKYDSDINEEVLVGCMRYHFDDDNPFYDNGTFPENKYVIEIEDAEEVIDDVIEFDFIRLIPVVNNGEFSKEKLEKHLRQIYNNKR